MNQELMEQIHSHIFLMSKHQKRREVGRLLVEAYKELLRVHTALALASGELSTQVHYSDKHPEEVMDYIYEQARKVD